MDEKSGNEDHAHIQGILLNNPLSDHYSLVPRFFPDQLSQKYRRTTSQYTCDSYP